MAKSDKNKARAKPKDRAQAAKDRLRKPKKLRKSAKRVRPEKVAPPAPVAFEPDAAVLDRLWSVVLSRRNANPAVSHSARLLSRGTAKVAQKFGEEAVECLIEAVAENREALVAESADVLYHLLVLWVSSNVKPAEVWAELKRREGVSGIAEKASRVKRTPVARRLQTTKIP